MWIVTYEREIADVRRYEDIDDALDDIRFELTGPARAVIIERDHETD